MADHQNDLQTILHTLNDLQSRLERDQRVLYRQIEALFWLNQRLPFRLPLPPMRGYAISPDFANVILTLIEANRPKLILELGSGISTIIAGYALERIGAGRILSLDDGAEFAQTTRSRLDQHGVSAFAQVVHAPLVPLVLDGLPYQWYDPAAVASATAPDASIDLLIVDGPPQYGNPHPLARYPALPVLWDRLSDQALILMDDTDRADEQQIAQRWLDKFPIRLIEMFDTEKGAKLFQVDKEQTS
jgi:predicted O-methyltransferase YrrM